MLYGAAAFLLAHAVEWQFWDAYFGRPGRDAWFLNTGQATGWTVICVAVAALIGGLGTSDRRELITAAANVAAGATVAMAATLFTIGPGTIFPLVIVIGGALLTAAAFAGALVLFPARR
jgi:hypothetical protein